MKQKVQVWIRVRDEPGAWRVLLLKTRPDRGGFWQPVTGSVEDGESPIAAAAREAAEETGLSFDGAPAPVGRPFAFEKKGKKFMETPFTLLALKTGRLLDTGVPAVTIDPSEHVEYRWISPEGAIAMLAFESNREILRALMPRLNSYS